jgi:hypothetical protein
VSNTQIENKMRPIPGYPGYFASEGGKIFSVRPWHNKTDLREIKGSITGGYRKVGLRRGGKSHVCLVHQLVLFTFVGPRPKGMLGLHGMGGQLDNRVVNLYWGTPAQNQNEDRQRDGTLTFGEKHHKAKLSWDDVSFIRSNEHARHSTLAKICGVDSGTIADVLRGVTWKVV